MNISILTISVIQYIALYCTILYCTISTEQYCIIRVIPDHFFLLFLHPILVNTSYIILVL
jgi:hypothetical protein